MKKTLRTVTTNVKENKFFQEEEIERGTVPVSNERAVINLYEQIRYQKVLGFGAALTESSAYNYSLLTPEQKDEFMRAYFDRTEGIGYNFGRCHINSCDFALDIYDYVQPGDKTLETFDISRDRKYIIPFIKDALKYCKEELVFFASPWSPPAYMKDNQSPIRGGKLLEEYKAVWAKYYAKFIRAYEEEGIKISAVSVQNEPKALQKWESCFFEPEDEREFLERYLIPALDEAGLSDIKLIIWDHNKERVYDRAEKILKDSDFLQKKVWAVGHHWYSGDHFDGLRLVHEVFGKAMISSEICCTMKMDPFAAAERYGKEICENFNNFDVAFCDWNILLSRDGGPFHNRTEKTSAELGVVFDDVEGGCLAPVLYDQEKKALIYTPIYYYIGHFSKFIQRGAVRFANTKYTEDLHVASFLNPDGGKVVVLMNKSDLSLPANLRLPDEVTRVDIPAHSIMTVLF